MYKFWCWIKLNFSSPTVHTWNYLSHISKLQSFHKAFLSHTLFAARNNWIREDESLIDAMVIMYWSWPTEWKELLIDPLISVSLSLTRISLIFHVPYFRWIAHAINHNSVILQYFLPVKISFPSIIGTLCRFIYYFFCWVLDLGISHYRRMFTFVTTPREFRFLLRTASKYFKASD